MQDDKRATSIRMIKPNVSHCLCVWAWIHSLGPLSHFSESPSRRICGQTHSLLLWECMWKHQWNDWYPVCVRVRVCVVHRGHMFGLQTCACGRWFRTCTFVRVATDGWNRTKTVDAWQTNVCVCDLVTELRVLCNCFACVCVSMSRMEDRASRHQHFVSVL